MAHQRAFQTSTWEISAAVLNSASQRNVVCVDKEHLPAGSWRASLLTATVPDEAFPGPSPGAKTWQAAYQILSKPFLTHTHGVGEGGDSHRCVDRIQGKRVPPGKPLQLSKTRETLSDPFHVSLMVCEGRTAQPVRDQEDHHEKFLKIKYWLQFYTKLKFDM